VLRGKSRKDFEVAEELNLQPVFMSSPERGKELTGEKAFLDSRGDQSKVSITRGPPPQDTG
jgi:hypothetical protein